VFYQHGAVLGRGTGHAVTQPRIGQRFDFLRVQQRSQRELAAGVEEVQRTARAAALLGQDLQRSVRPLD
jgi:hypothetical protein